MVQRFHGVWGSKVSRALGFKGFKGPGRTLYSAVGVGVRHDRRET